MRARNKESDRALARQTAREIGEDIRHGGYDYGNIITWAKCYTHWCWCCEILGQRGAAHELRQGYASAELDSVWNGISDDQPGG